jgi:hypothetical protein
VHFTDSVGQGSCTKPLLYTSLQIDPIQYKRRWQRLEAQPNGSDSRTSYWPKSAIAFWEVVGEQKRSAGPETIPIEIIENVANFICNRANRRRPSLPARAPCRLTNSDWPSASEHGKDDWAADHMSRHGGSKMNCRQPPYIIVTWHVGALARTSHAPHLLPSRLCTLCPLPLPVRL